MGTMGSSVVIEGRGWLLCWFELSPQCTLAPEITLKGLIFHFKPVVPFLDDKTALATGL